MLFEILKNDSGKLRLEKIAGHRNNPACIKLLNVKSEAEAFEAFTKMGGSIESDENNPAESIPQRAGQTTTTTESAVTVNAEVFPETAQTEEPFPPGEPSVKKTKRKSPQEA